jgi:hypothetical protein
MANAILMNGQLVDAYFYLQLAEEIHNSYPPIVRDRNAAVQLCVSAHARTSVAYSWFALDAVALYAVRKVRSQQRAKCEPITPFPRSLKEKIKVLSAHLDFALDIEILDLMNKHNGFRNRIAHGVGTEQGTSAMDKRQLVTDSLIYTAPPLHVAKKCFDYARRLCEALYGHPLPLDLCLSDRRLPAR